MPGLSPTGLPSLGSGGIIPNGSSTAGNNASVYAIERIVSATGAASSGGTISSSATQWAGTNADWKPGHFSPAEITAGLAADGADPDGDGVVNSDEYTLGTAPRTSNQQPLTITRSGNNCTQTFVARSATGSGSADAIEAAEKR